MVLGGLDGYISWKTSLSVCVCIKAKVPWQGYAGLTNKCVRMQRTERDNNACSFLLLTTYITNRICKLERLSQDSNRVTSARRTLGPQESSLQLVSRH